MDLSSMNATGVKSMILVNRFYVIESLPPGDRKTGKELVDDCLSVVLEKGKGIKLDYVALSNREELIHTLEGILIETEKGCIPIIHFEMHGQIIDEEKEFVFILSSGEKMKADEIKPIITNININTKNHLFISVSACYGAGLFSIALPTERSPYWAILGPNKSTEAGVLLNGYIEFYSSLFFNMNGNIALHAARNLFDLKDVQLLLFSSSQLFKAFFKHFEEKHTTEREPESRQKREVYFNKARDFFFMYDLYPEEKQENVITYNDILAL